MLKHIRSMVVSHKSIWKSLPASHKLNYKQPEIWGEALENTRDICSPVERAKSKGWKNMGQLFTAETKVRHMMMNRLSWSTRLSWNAFTPGYQIIHDCFTDTLWQFGVQHQAAGKGKQERNQWCNWTDSEPPSRGEELKAGCGFYSPTWQWRFESASVNTTLFPWQHDNKQHRSFLGFLPWFPELHPAPPSVYPPL